jgi:hypothetical protein
MTVAALSYVSGWTCRAAALLSKTASFFEFAATRQESLLRTAIFRRLEFGHCRAIHDTNLGKLVAIAEVVAREQEATKSSVAGKELLWKGENPARELLMAIFHLVITPSQLSANSFAVKAFCLDLG